MSPIDVNSSPDPTSSPATLPTPSGASAKALQSVAQSVALAIQDATDNLRNVNTIGTTAIGAAMSQLLAAAGQPPSAPSGGSTAADAEHSTGDTSGTSTAVTTSSDPYHAALLAAQGITQQGVKDFSNICQAATGVLQTFQDQTSDVGGSGPGQSTTPGGPAAP